METCTQANAAKGESRPTALVTAASSSLTKRLEVLKQFRVLMRSIKRHYQWVEEQCGLSGAQLWALSEIAGAPGLKVSDLAEQLGIHLSTASNMLRRLEELELVRRLRIGEDHRVVQLELTDKGKDILRVAPRPLAGILQQVLADLPQQRLDTLHADLEEVISVMKFKGDKARSAPSSEI